MKAGGGVARDSILEHALELSRVLGSLRWLEESHGWIDGPIKCPIVMVGDIRGVR